MFGTVTATRLNVRAMPSPRGRKLGELEQGVVIDVLGEKTGWLEIDYRGTPAFVSDDYVDLFDRPPRMTGIVSANLLNVRDRPATSGVVLGTLGEGTRVDIVSRQESWLEIRFQQGTAYVSGRYVEQHQLQDLRRGIVEAGSLNVRGGPTTGAQVLGQLPRGTEIVIESSIGSWHEILFNGTRGYISGKYVRTYDAADEEAPIDIAENDLDEALPEPVAPPQPEAAEALPLAPLRLLRVGGSAEERKVAETWNQFGGLLESLSEEKRIDTACSVAVLCVESSGRGFDRNNDGRMIVRFENHKFWKYWGKTDPSRFRDHFTYDPGKVWTGHKWRSERSGEWQKFHGSQVREWEVLNFARSIDDTAALLSISMGAPQIMGFHYERLGYRTVQEMFDEFAADIGAQITGFFDFMSTAMVQRLRRQDFTGFAALYNGSGQKEKYGNWIKSHFDAYKRLST